MKKLLFILLIGVIAFNLTSCLPTGANKEEGSLPAVVNKTEGFCSILTAIGEFAAPDLISKPLESGDCILAYFTLDWDNQPESVPPYYASDITYILIDQNYATVRSDFDETETILSTADLLPIQSVVPQSYNPIMDGKFFLGFTHLAPKEQTMKYIAIVKPNLENVTDAAVDVYLIAQKTNTPNNASNTTVGVLYAIDMRNVIREFGKEATYEAALDYRVKELKINLKYCTGYEDDVPIYEPYKYNNQNTTILLSVFI